MPKNIIVKLMNFSKGKNVNEDKEPERVYSEEAIEKAVSNYRKTLMDNDEFDYGHNIINSSSDEY